ncbi:TPA: hypothetical protein ACIBLT_002668 [Salmonella enterica subsp. enterica serovar Javiana]
MTTITNKKQYPSEQYLNELITNMEFAAMAPVEVVRLMAAELQERRKAESEPAGYHVIKECGKVGCSVATLEEAEKTRDFWNKKWTIRPYFYSAQPVPIVPEKMSKHALFEVAIARFSKMNEGFPIKRFKADWVISWMLENFPPVAQKQGDN